MREVVVDDELWELIQPLLPRRRRRCRYPGRRRLDDRLVLNGILFVLTTGIAWQRLPQELGFGSGMTCWRRLRDWRKAGVFEHLHELLLAKLRQADRLDLSRAVCDSATLRALLGGDKTGPSPVDRSKPGCKHSPDRRRQRRPSRLPAHRRQPTRRHPAAPARRSDPAPARQARPPTPPTRHPPRRPRLRLPTTPTGATRPRNQANHRQTQNPARIRTRHATLGRRTHPLLAPPDETTARPLRTPRRDPRSLPRPRLLPDLLPPPQELKLK